MNRSLLNGNVEEHESKNRKGCEAQDSTDKGVTDNYLCFFKCARMQWNVVVFLLKETTVIRSAAEGDERIYQGGPDGINWGTLSKEAQAANLRYSMYSWRYLHNV
jgi:hypothetical protein